MAKRSLFNKMILPLALVGVLSAANLSGCATLENSSH